MEFLGMKNTVSKILKKCTSYSYSRLDSAKEKIYECEAIGTETVSNKAHREKYWGENTASVTCESTASGLTYMY